MGKQIDELYQQIRNKYGEISLYRLVVKTRISSSQVKTIEDTEENVLLVKKAIKDLGFTTSDELENKKKDAWWKRILRR